MNSNKMAPQTGKFKVGDVVRVTLKHDRLIRENSDELLQQANNIGWVADTSGPMYVVSLVQNDEGNWLGVYCLEDELELI